MIDEKLLADSMAEVDLEETQETLPDPASESTIDQAALDAAFAETEEIENIQYQSNTMEGVKKPADRQKEVLDLSKRFNVPTSYADRNYDQLKAEVKFQEMEELKKSHPHIANTIDSPAKAALVHKNAEGLKKLDNVTATIATPTEKKSKTFMDYVSNASEAFKKGSRHGTEDMVNNVQLLASLVGARNNIGTYDETAERYAKYRQKIAKRPALPFMEEFQKAQKKEWNELKTAFNKSLTRGLSGLVLESPTLLAELSDVFETFLINERSLTYMLGQQVPQVAIAMGTGITAAKTTGLATATFAPQLAPATATAVGVTTAVGTQIATSALIEMASQLPAYLESKYKVNLSDPLALRKALANKEIADDVIAMARRKGLTTSMIETGLTLIGARGLAKFKPTTVVGKGVKTVTNKVVAGAAAGTGEGIGQYVATGEVDGIEVINEFALDAPAGTITDTAAIAAVTTKKKVVDTVKHIHKNVEKAKDAKEFHQGVDDLVQTLQEVDINEVGPEVVEQMVEAKGESKFHFQVDEFEDHWNKLGENPESKADELLPNGRSDLEQAREAGVNIEIPLKDVITKLSQEDSFGELMQLARQSNDSLSRSEADRLTANIPSMVKELQRQARIEQRKFEKQLDDREAVRKDIEGQLLNLPNFDSKSAKYVSELYVSNVVANAEVIGVDPATFFAKKRLDIKAGVSTDIDTGVLYQRDPDTGINLRDGETIAPELKDVKEVELPRIKDVNFEKYVHLNLTKFKAQSSETLQGRTFKNRHSGQSFTITPQAVNRMLDEVIRQRIGVKLNEIESLTEEAVTKSKKNKEAIRLLQSVDNMSAIANFGYLAPIARRTAITADGTEVYHAIGRVGDKDRAAGIRFEVKDGQVTYMQPVSFKEGSVDKARVAGQKPVVGDSSTDKLSITEFASLINVGKDRLRTQNQENVYFQQDSKTFNKLNQDAMGFYSKLKTALSPKNTGNFKSLPAKDLISRIRKVEGIKEDELQYTGIIEWLEAYGDNKVTRQELDNFLDNNGIKLEQVILSEMYEEEYDDYDSDNRLEDSDWREENVSYEEVMGPEWDIETFVDYSSEYDYLIGEELREDIKDILIDGENREAHSYLWSYIEDLKEEDPEKYEEILNSVREGKIDQDAVLSIEGVERDIEDRIYEYANERATDPNDDYGFFKLEDVNNDIVIYYNSDIWDRAEVHYRGDYVDQLDGVYSENEMKVQAISLLADQGYIDLGDGPILDRNDVSPTVQIDPDYLQDQIEQMYQNNKEALEKETIEEYKDYWKDFTGTPEERAAELERDARDLAESKIRTEWFETTGSKPVQITFGDFEGVITGSEEGGWFIEDTSIDYAEEGFKGTQEEAIERYKDILEENNQIKSDKPVADQSQLTEEEIFQQAVERLNKPQGRDKWNSPSWVLPNGENYKEILITFPQSKRPFRESVHFPNWKNYISHARMTTRETNKGDSVSFSEEYQSDWHQSGRKLGYRPIDELKEQEWELEIENRIEELDAEIMDLNIMIEEAIQESGILVELQERVDEAITKEKEQEALLDSLREERSFLIEENTALEDEGLVTFDEETGEISFRDEDTKKAYQGRLEAILNIENRIKDGERLENEYYKERREAERALYELNRDLDALPEIKEERLKREILLREKSFQEDRLRDAPPEAPYAKTEAWIELGLKRMIRMAAEAGYKYFSWSPSWVQKERWGTERVIIQKDPKSGRFLVSAKDQHEGFGRSPEESLEELARQHGELKEESKEISSELELMDLLTKTLTSQRTFKQNESLAKRLWADMQKMEDGGTISSYPRWEGMEAFYNKMIPNAAKKLAKKLDSSIKKLDVIDMPLGDPVLEVVEVTTTPEQLKEIQDYLQQAHDSRAFYEVGKMIAFFNDVAMATSGTTTLAEAFKETFENYSSRFQKFFGSKLQEMGEHNFQGIKLEEKPNDFQALAIPLTEELVKNATLGQPLFQQGEKGPKGMIDVSDPSKMTITLLENANKSTILHEMGHAFFENMKLVATELDQMDSEKFTPAQKKFREDQRAFLDFLGVSTFDQIETEHHEKFARVVEAYLMKGKAPVGRLKRAFNAFKTWLVNIYKSIAGVEKAGGFSLDITPELREALDRLVATEAEIQAEKQASGYDTDSLEVMAKALKLSPKETEDLLAAHEEADIEAERSLYKEHLKQLKKKQTKEYKAKKKELTKKYQDMADENKLYQDIEAIKTGEINGQKAIGYPTLKMNTDALRPLLPEGGLRSFPRSLYSSEGIHPDLVAELLGYDSAQEMVTQIAESPSKKEFVRIATENELLQLYPDFLDPAREEELKVASLNAIDNDLREKALVKNFNALMKKDPRRAKALIRKSGKRLPTNKEMKKAAEQRVKDTSLRNAKPENFRRLEYKSRQEALKAGLNGNFEKVLQSKMQEIFNHNLSKQAGKLTDKIMKEIEKQKKRFKKSDKELAKVGQLDMFKAAQAIMARYGMLTEAQVDRLDVYLQQLQAYDANAYNKVKGLSDMLLDTPDGDYRDLTLGQVEEILEVVDALYELGRAEKMITVDGKKVEKEKAISDLLGAIAGRKSRNYKNENSAIKKLKNVMVSIEAWLTKTEFVMRFLDKDDQQGPFRKYLWNRVNDTQVEYEQKKIDRLKELNEIIKTYFKDTFKKDEDINMLKYFKGIDPEFHTMKKSEIIMALVHSGNDSNKQKLLLGRGWGALDAAGNLVTRDYDNFINEMIKEKVITKDIMDGVQAIWDLFEDIKPEIQKAHKEVYGYFFKEIEANPIETPWGTYRGGYAPAVTDPLLVPAEALRQDQASTDQVNAQYTFAHTNKGMTIERVQQYNKALSLDFSIIPAHVEKAVRFATIEPALTDLNKIVNDRTFVNNTFEYNQDLIKSVFKPWLARFATQQTVPPSDNKGVRALNQYVNELRTNANQQLMFMNIVNTVENLTDIPAMFARISGRKIMGALGNYVSKPTETSKMIKEKSTFMRQRMENQIFEIHDTYKELMIRKNTILGNAANFRDQLKKNAYILQQTLQNNIEIVAWTAAYDEGLIKFNSETEAVRYADSQIRELMGSGRAIDIAKAEAGDAWQKVALTFWSFFLTKGNFVRFTQKEHRLKAYVLAMAIPAVLSTAFRRALAGKGLEDEEDRDNIFSAAYHNPYFDIFLMSQVRFVAATLPMGGSGVRLLEGMATDVTYDDRLSIAPLVGMIESMKGIKGLMTKEELRGRDIRDTLNFFGTMTGLPLGPVGRPLGFIIDVEQGKQSAETPLELTQGLLTGRSGKKD